MPISAGKASKFRNTIASRLWLRLIETSTYEIPERLVEIDPDLFLVFNTRKQEYEVHDAAVPIRAFSRVFAAAHLDCRLLKRVEDARLDRDPIGQSEVWSKAEQAAIQRKQDIDARAFAEDLADAAHLDNHGRRMFSAS